MLGSSELAGVVVTVRPLHRADGRLQLREIKWTITRVSLAFEIPLEMLLIDSE